MNVYLTPEKKSYYINELNKAKTINDSNWDVDNGLIDVLDCINENPNIQTLLSKKSEDLRSNSPQVNKLSEALINSSQYGRY
jgi:hypothetical protein